jgi:HEAT repeat protein
MDRKIIFSTSWDRIAENPDNVPIAVIIDGMKSKDQSISSYACRAFHNRRNKEEVKPLVENLLKDQRGYIRNIVINVLPEIGEVPSRIDSLIKIALKDNDSDVRISAFEIVADQMEEAGDIGRYYNFLVKGSGHKDDKIRRHALEKLLNTDKLIVLKDNQHYFDLLSKALKDKNVEIRKNAIEALQQRHNDSLNRLLVEPLTDDSPQIRVIAIKTIGEIGGSFAVTNLIIALKDIDLSNQILAAKYLDKLGWQPNTPSEKICYKLAKGDWNGLEDFGVLAAKYICLFLGTTGVEDVLIKIGKPSVRILCDYLSMEDSNRRIDAAILLGKMGDRETLEYLERSSKTEKNGDVLFYMNRAIDKIKEHT